MNATNNGWCRLTTKHLNLFFMKLNHLILSIFALFAIQSCDSTDAYFGGDTGNPTNPDTFSRIADIIKFDNVPTDTLAFNPAVDSEVTGSFGTKIILPASSVGGNSIPTELYVVLREYPTISKMAMNSVQTVTDEELLVTGGNFWWKIIDAEGNEYSLNAPSQVSAEQPVVLDMGDYRDMAGYWEGNEINLGPLETVNWTFQETGSGFGQENIFHYYGLNLYWVNCDVLYDYPGDRTQFTVNLNTNAEIVPGEEIALLIVDDFPSIIYLPSTGSLSFETYANSIPVGITGTVIGLALDTDNNLHVGSSEITVTGDDAYSIDLAQGSVAQLQNLINQATN